MNVVERLRLTFYCSERSQSGQTLRASVLKLPKHNSRVGQMNITLSFIIHHREVAQWLD